MAIEQKTIDRAEVDRILALQEGHFLDLKGADIAPAKLSETISAFCNTAGGELYVGIIESSDRQTRFWAGFRDMEAANGLFQVIQRMTPLSNHYNATWLTCAELPGKYVLFLSLPKTREIVFATNSHAYVRHNAQNNIVTGEAALHQLRLDKGIISFEDEVVNVPHAAISNSVTGMDFILGVVPSTEPEDWMRKQNLIVQDGRPIVAGILLYADEPQAALPKRSAIKIYRYQTTADEGSREQLVFDPITVEGPLYNQITEAVARTKKIIEEIRTLTDSGLEPVTYPDETLHEILTNAVLHRDYSIASDTHVRIYDNRIEVESPGRLAGHVTTENFLREQFARNPKVVRLINKFPNPPNKDVGEGLNTAFEAMRKLKLKDPEIVESEHSVVVHIRHTRLASPQDAVMNYLQDHAEITNKIAREICAISSENVMKDVFVSLQKRRLLERVPGKRGNASAWRKHTGHWERQLEKDLGLDDTDSPPVDRE